MLLLVSVVSAGCQSSRGGSGGDILEAQIHVPGLGWLDCGSKLTVKQMKEIIKEASIENDWVCCGDIYVRPGDINGIK